MTGAHIPVVIDIIGQNGEIPSPLPGQITHAVGNARRDAHREVRQDIQIQQSVTDAAGEYGAVGAALQSQSEFHLDSFFPVQNVLCVLYYINPGKNKTIFKFCRYIMEELRPQ